MSRAARSHAMDARMSKKPINQQLHTTAGLVAAKNSLATGDGNIFISAQCRIKSASAKDQRTTDPSLGQWGKPWPKDAYMSGKFSCHLNSFSLLKHPNSHFSEVLDEYLATLNVRWANDKGMALLP
jgi:hypothetical protein